MAETEKEKLQPKGDVTREAIDSLRGYVYQIYQSALALVDLESEELLFLEVAEDYAVVAKNALEAVQVKETSHNITINSEDVIASIDSFVDLRQKNPDLKVRLRHLTTSKIGKEKSAEHRIGNSPTLEVWRKLSKVGDLEPLRKILLSSKVSRQTKNYIQNLNDNEFREGFLKRIHFDCGALDSKYLLRQLRSRLLKLVIERGGVNSQVDGCLNSILLTLLQTATQKTDRCIDNNILEELLEKATQIPVNRAQFDQQSKLINQALNASVSQGTSLVSTRFIEPRPIDEVPLPPAIATRKYHIDNILSSLRQYGISWIFGAAGVGKTLSAKIAARYLGGGWASINLRGLSADQVNMVLSSAIDSLPDLEFKGILLDDLECPLESRLIDVLLYLQAICDRTDLLLIYIAPKPPSSDFLFSANLSSSITQKIDEFSEEDIHEILIGLGVDGALWAKYIHVLSGGGHPQLAIAAIQSMESNGWDVKELRTLNSLMKGNPIVEQIRANTRERLLNELPDGSRRLLERLSLRFGSFRRNFVLDMAQVSPTVLEGGILFDQLIGSWIDQQSGDRFALSPLLSNLAVNTLSDRQKQAINFEIASSLIRGRSLDPIEANSALLAALSGKNTDTIMKLCMSVFSSDQKDLEMIAPHLMTFTLMRTDNFAYEDEPGVSQMFRGAQLILVCQGEEAKKEKVIELLECFEEESNRVENKIGRSITAFMVFSKLLSIEPKFGAFPKFWELVRKLDELLEKRNQNLPPELFEIEDLLEIDGFSVVAIMFLNQVSQIKQINELLPLFIFLDSCTEEFREKLLIPLNKSDFSVNMLLVNAWLSEHESETINPTRHVDIFSQLENYARSWQHTELSVCCRKYRVIITDEYGGKKDQALELIDEGLKIYGETNSELVRAKAKVLYRAEDHQSSLELSKTLIEGDAPLNKTEKAFLGRDAAISAEKQGDFKTAKKYFLYGWDAARKCEHHEMVPMSVGLLADAALSSWHAGDRETCLLEFVTVLHELRNIDPESSLRAAHCHATSRHVLLWLDQEATGEKRLLPGGEETKIFPGVVSNPEPHSEIGERFITPLEMAWYMLATVENNCCLDVGVTENLDEHLPNGRVYEGQFLLTNAMMRKSLKLLDSEVFIIALKETLAQLSYANQRGGYKNSFNINDVTYGFLPVPTVKQLRQLSDISEQFMLCFMSTCIFASTPDEIEVLLDRLVECPSVIVRDEFKDCLHGSGEVTDFNTSLAELLNTHRKAVQNSVPLSPLKVMELGLKSLLLSTKTSSSKIMAKFLFKWLKSQWTFISKNQSFLLKSSNFHKDAIEQVISSKNGERTKDVIELLLAIIPTIGFQNENEIMSVLKEL